MAKRKATKPPRTRSADKIASGFTHVLFEVDEFFRDAHTLYGPRARIDYVPILEAYLVHARNLIAFVGPNDFWDDRDMMPSDFDVEWSGPKGTVGKRLVEARCPWNPSTTAPPQWRSRPS